MKTPDAFAMGAHDAHMETAIPAMLAHNKKHRVAVLQERKRFADELDAYAFDDTVNVHTLAGCVSQHNLEMRKLEADHHKKISDILKVPKLTIPAKVIAKAKKETAAKFFARKKKESAAKKKPAPKKPVKKAAKRKR